jgi:hypothetical protein
MFRLIVCLQLCCAGSWLPQTRGPICSLSQFRAPASWIPRAGLLDTARDAACASVRALEGLLGVPHALPKLDLVGIPNFAAGAMENW